MSEPNWVTAEEIIEINKNVTAETNEPYGVRGMGLVDSVANRARNLYSYSGETDMFQSAAIYAEVIPEVNIFSKKEEVKIFSRKEAGGIHGCDIFPLKNGVEIQTRQDDGYVRLMEGGRRGTPCARRWPTTS